jgi:hypothetical protein
VKGKYHENPHLKNVGEELACTEEIVKQDQALHQYLERSNQSRRRGIFNLKGVAYQGAREASGFWS